MLACAQKEELQEQFVVERLGGQIMISYLSSNKEIAKGTTDPSRFPCCVLLALSWNTAGGGNCI